MIAFVLGNCHYQLFRGLLGVAGQPEKDADLDEQRRWVKLLPPEMLRIAVIVRECVVIVVLTLTHRDPVDEDVFCWF